MFMTRPCVRFLLGALVAMAAPSEILASQGSCGRTLLQFGSVFQENMVLHSQRPRIWGKGQPRSTVTVSLKGVENITFRVPTDAQGRWLATIPKNQLAFGDAQLEIQDSCAKKTLKNIKIGEVWLCSGQSNMSWRLKASTSLASALAESESLDVQKNLRLLRVPPSANSRPQEDLPKTVLWSKPQRQQLTEFSAVCYHMGLDLQKKLKRPIGLIQSAYGGSVTESWIAEPHLDKKFRIKRPWTRKSSSYLYNAMIAPLTPLKISGVAWYQGEANVNYARNNVTILSTLIGSWRSLFQNKELAFHIVQLANYGPPQEGRPGKALSSKERQAPFAHERQAHFAVAQKLNKVFLIPAIDLASAKEARDSEIHPRHKILIGKRLARTILARDYGALSDTLPEWKYQETSVVNKKIRIPLYWPKGVTPPKVGTSLKGFSLRAQGQAPVHAESAKVVSVDVKKQRVLLEVAAKSVTKPYQLRFAWAQNPVLNFRTQGYGDPLTPFCIVKGTRGWTPCLPHNLKPAP